MGVVITIHLIKIALFSTEKGIVQMERLPLPPATFLLFAGQVLPYISSSENQGA